MNSSVDFGHAKTQVNSLDLAELTSQRSVNRAPDAPGCSGEEPDFQTLFSVTQRGSKSKGKFLYFHSIAFSLIKHRVVSICTFSIGHGFLKS